MIHFMHCVRRFAPALPLRGTSLREDGLREATDAALLTRQHDHPQQTISAVWTSIRKLPRLHLNNRRDLSKVQGQLSAGSPHTSVTAQRGGIDRGCTGRCNDTRQGTWA